MKYCMCSTWAKEHKVLPVLQMAQGLELDGIELWSGHVAGYLAEGHTLSELKALMDEMGLECVVIAPYLNLIDAAGLETNMAEAETCIRYAQALSCKMVRVFLGDKASNEMTKQEWRTCETALRTLCDKAAQAGVTLVLEVHNDQPTDTKEAILRVLRLIKHPALRLIFDGFNFYPSGLEMMDAYAPLKPYSVHYHFKNLLWDPHVCVPLDEGDVDFRPLIRALRRDGYDGYISFEYFAADPSAMIRASKDWFCRVYSEESED